MVKQGGNSYNTSPTSKKGMVSRSKCNLCGRSYKQEWSKENHQKACAEYRKAHNI